MLDTLSGPIIGAVIGYCTNYIAVKMLFYPRKEIRIGGWKVPFTPGAIPKGKPRLAKGIGNIVANTLLTEEDIRKKILTPETEAVIVDKIMEVLSSDIQSGATKLLQSEENYEMCKEQLAENLTGQILDALKNIDLGGIIAQEGERVIKEKVQGTMLAMFISDEMLASFIHPIGEEIITYIDENGETQHKSVNHHVFTPKKGKDSASVNYVFEAEADCFKLDNPIEVREQVLAPTPIRNGFTVVEWGGTEINGDKVY